MLVIEADVAATDNKVFGSLPNLRPATAFIPNCAPMVGLAAILGTIVIPDLLRSVSAFFFGVKTFRIKSLKSYCLLMFSTGLLAFCAFIRRESAFNESAGVTTWALVNTGMPKNSNNSKLGR